MVEHCNQTIEDLIRKCMLNQHNWCPMLPSVLFAIRTSRHSSTGFTPFCMLYNKDPIMPFEHANKLKHAGNDDEYDSDAAEIYKPGVTSGSCGTHFLNNDTNNNNLVSTIQNLEDQCRQIFDKAHKSIKKAQIHQAKGYNNRQSQG